MNGGNPSHQIDRVVADAMLRVPYSPASDMEIEIFSQTWGSTALGFGGIGGQMMTSAYTILVFVESKTKCFVYFAGRFAYEVADTRSPAFCHGYLARKMPSVRDLQLSSKRPPQPPKSDKPKWLSESILSEAMIKKPPVLSTIEQESALVGNLLVAMQSYRRRTGCSPKAAKERVEAFLHDFAKDGAS
jgi:hypothetical protein